MRQKILSNSRDTVQTNQAEISTLTPAERDRYSRHLLLPEVGFTGQEKLKSSKVLVVGAGGLGSPVALYLAAAGVGTIAIAEFDAIALSNLQRQILHTTADVGTAKSVSARKRLQELNPEVHVVLHEQPVCATNIDELLHNQDVVIDTSDNFQTRYLINDACVLAGKPLVYGAIYRFEGQASVFRAGGPCYRCMFPEPPQADAVPNCAEGGVLGVVAGFIGMVQATETLKLLLGVGTSLSGRLMLYNALDMQVNALTITRKKDCPVCGEHPTIRTALESAQSCQASATGAQETVEGRETTISPEVLAGLLDSNSVLLLDVRNPQETQICRIEGSKLIPLKELETRMTELDRESNIVIHCKSGARGQKALALLHANGFRNLRNLDGGILAWIKDIDPSMQSY